MVIFLASSKSDKDVQGQEERLRIVAMMHYTGELSITAEEKAKTINGVDDFAAEAEKVKKGLGIHKGSVANVGETPITAAAMAVIKMAISYNINLSDVQNLYYNTESSNDISQNNGIAVINAVNQMSRTLRKQAGINVGDLSDSVIVMHSQSACVSGVAMLSNISTNGIRGKSLIITADDARYKFGTNADETAGFGAMAILLDPKAKSGVTVSEIAGSSRSNVVDFVKPIDSPNDETKGMAMVSKYAIVFGKYSEYVYLLHTYKSMKQLFERSGMDIDDLENFTGKYTIIGHVPYPGMVNKAVGNLVVHFMRSNDLLKDQILSEIGDGAKMPELNGFKTQEKAFEFIQDVANIVLKLEVEREQISRGANYKEKSISDNSRVIAEAKSERLDQIMQKYEIKADSRLAAAITAAQAKLSVIAANGGTLDSLISALSGIYCLDPRSKGVVNDFEDMHNAFNGKVRKTEAFKQIYSKLGVGESLKVPSVTGNIYTGSAFLALESHILHSNPEQLRGKEVVFIGYGSGAESYSLFLNTKEALQMKLVLEKVAALESREKREISAEEYEQIRKARTVSDYVGEAPMLSQYSGEFIINKERLSSYALQLSREVGSVPLKSAARSNDAEPSKARASRYKASVI